MDFSTHPDQDALRDLTNQILTERSTHKHLDALDDAGTWFDADTWTELANSGIVGIGLPESVGGGGMTFFDVHLTLLEVGRTVAHVPLLETIVLGALPIARFGSEAMQQAILPGVAAGTTLLTAALSEDGRDDPLHPQTRATRTDDGWRLTGTKTRVAAGAIADHVIIPARTDDGHIGLFLVDPGADGITLTAQVITSRRPDAHIELEDTFVADDRVIGAVDAAGSDRLRWLVEAGTSAVCSVQSGVCGEALVITADYAKEREQFRRKIGQFQAVNHRLADAYIDNEGIRLTALQAAFLISDDADASNAVSIAKWWAAEGGHRIAHAAQHVHGGVGIDYDYKLHRYFTKNKELEFTLGSAAQQLLDIGKRIAAEPV